MSATYTYSPADVAIVFAGLRLEAFAEGSMATVEPNADAASMSVGADGQAVRSVSANNAGTFTIRLQHTSPSNGLLENLYRTNAQFPGAIVDTINGETISCEVCWVRSRPSIEMGAEAADREWVIDGNPINWPAGS